MHWPLISLVSDLISSSGNDESEQYADFTLLLIFYETGVFLKDKIVSGLEFNGKVKSQFCSVLC